MAFLRPAARAAVLRWREALVGAGVVAVGLWFVAAGGLLFWIGWIVAAAGGALTAAGVQRGRFRQGGDGAGVVRVVEGQLAYFGPEDGGTMAVAEIEWLAQAGGAWVLRDASGTTLRIPVNALGADALFDVFAAIPGVGRVPQPDGSPDRIIWRRGAGDGAGAGRLGRH